VTSLAALPETRLEDLPIPQDAKPQATWPESMLEMAAHIGPFATLQLVDQFGGKELYVPLQAAGWHVANLIGWVKAQKLCQIYGRERLPIPVARTAIFHAKRQPIIAAVRARKMTLTEGAHILRTSRTYLSGLVNADRQGKGDAPVPELSPRRRQYVGQMEMFPEPEAEEGQ
jgi:hypothetical protein